ncbi:hypothetical protein Z517_08968 [Fonsecaea pedrosoi CBS 271.37]|uniref:Uncharacterized protein n=1 Tax=Fonsecaea pedrosoi CBS 271.37 TaxID=1442368 RepID=A0A0D2GED9_9EURO|nr:uncharacterized protein Z517_08968 [Fonsecaea pedrosoi CBS 271.37]KIW79128.1 hypothetical protein Z517_08968 [Fonsecaea pedrosoi CBS 271.37]
MSALLKVPSTAAKWKFYFMATRPENFFVQQGDELEYRSDTVTKAGAQPILVGGLPLVVPRLRVRRDGSGNAIRQAPELWMWEELRSNADGSRLWHELGFCSGPKDLEQKLLDRAREEGNQVTGPAGALQDGRDSWARFIFSRPGEQAKQMSEVRKDYHEEQKRLQEAE